MFVRMNHLLATVSRTRSGCSTKKSHISLDASTLRAVGPSIQSGIPLPPGQVWPPPRMVYDTTVAPPAQPVYARRVTSAEITESTGFALHRFRRAQSAVHVVARGNGFGVTQDSPPWYGTTGSAVP